MAGTGWLMFGLRTIEGVKPVNSFPVALIEYSQGMIRLAFYARQGALLPGTFRSGKQHVCTASAERAPQDV